ncbi:MAG TPA: hypothetical protein VFA26_14300 [Gemmataceae bacterium]|nr:hypothetical protein [Gemmataceae bacterium]
MSPLLPFAAALALAAPTDAPAPLRYVRPAGDKFVRECEVATTRTDAGSTVVSTTDRGKAKMTLTLRYDKDGRLTSAEAVLADSTGTHTALLTVKGNAATLKRGGTSDFLKLPPAPVVTTAPDWSDVFQLVRRYDAKRAGKQEFDGVWIHPTQGTLTLKFTVEHVGPDQATAKGGKLTLDHYRVRLRSGFYHVWADGDRKVYKILPAGPRGGAPVVLEGFEEATRDLK